MGKTVMGIRGEKVDEDKVYASCPNCAALRRENSELNRLIDRANESCAALRGEVERLERMLADEKQKVANLDEYVLKGVAFRDELQTRIKQLEEEYAMAKFVAEDNKEWGLQHEKDKVTLKQELTLAVRMYGDAKKRIKQLQDAVDWALLPSTQFLLDVEMGSAFRDELRRRAGEG